MIAVDNQPIEASFFGEGKWLTDFVTPEAIDIQALYKNLTMGLSDLEEKALACWEWVANKVKYTRFVEGKLWISGKVSIQNDLWNLPSITARIKVGNCANKAFLLTSLLRNTLSDNEIYCVLGNLYNHKLNGHAWVQVNLNGQNYIMESTRGDVPLVPVSNTDRYEEVHLFNDKQIYAIPGKTVMTPFAACYSTWLKDYLDWAYIEGRK